MCLKNVTEMNVIKWKYNTKVLWKILRKEENAQAESQRNRTPPSPTFSTQALV